MFCGDQVTINRGAGTGIAVGQSWGVYAQGEVLIDPDTGENLGSNEAQVGLVTIKRVEAKLSFAEAVENNGIEKLAIVRPMAAPKPKPAAKAAPAASGPRRAASCSVTCCRASCRARSARSVRAASRS